ncbi:MAG: hypothetical protein DRJ52_09240 [Thermoprotei archaeon]|nr:MAG: hypothetical protein DRJ52_09240 [Thermoprotei archaeon]
MSRRKRRRENSLTSIEIRKILELFQYARYARLRYREKKAFHVTELARSITSPRSHGRANGAEVGRKAHSEIWSLDPYVVLQEDEVALPFPLAAEVRVEDREYIVYGVPDLIKFVRSTPVEVYEFKSYSIADKYSITQTQIYAWLCHKCFNSYPKAFLVLGWNGRKYSRKIEVKYDIKEVEEELKKAVMKILGC